MIINSQQLTEALIQELEKECYYYVSQTGEHFYKFNKTNEVIKRFFKYHKLNTKNHK